MHASELEEMVAVWERSRWEALPWLEARMAYSHADNLRMMEAAIGQGSMVWLAVAPPSPPPPDGEEEEEEAGEVVLGLLVMKPGWIEQLHVDPPAQGRGVGSALVALAMGLYPEGVMLYTHQRNMRARRFYEGRGFEVVAVGVSPPPELEPDVMYRWSPLRPRR